MKAVQLTISFLFLTICVFGQTTWSEISLPATNPSSGQLYELKVVSTNLAYTVGNKIPGSGPNEGLIFKYDGTSWTEISNPVTGNGLYIKSIAPVTTDDLYILSAKRTVYHWDGASWTDISSDLPGYNSNENFDSRNLFKTIAFASNDVYVIGKILNSDGGQADQEIYVAHYDGSNWTQATVPQSGVIDNVIAGTVMEVDATGPNDIWIATRGYITSPGMTQLGIWHYNGTEWTFAGEMIAAAGNVFLSDVSALSSDDVWFVGYYSPAQGTLAAFYAHYDGNSYSYTNQPLSTPDYQRYCIGASDGNHVWAGHQTNGTDFTFYDGSSWTSQATIITHTTGGGIRDIKPNNDCLWAVGYRTNAGTAPLLLKTCSSTLSVSTLFEPRRGLAIFPNPSAGLFTVSLSSREAEVIQVYNTVGILVHSEAINGQSQLDLTHLKSGFYILKSPTASMRFLIKK